MVRRHRLRWKLRPARAGQRRGRHDPLLGQRRKLRTPVDGFFQRNAGGDQLGNADATTYTAPSGAVVFAAGSLQFVWGLADPPPVSGRSHGLVDQRLQGFVRNMLDDLSAWHLADLNVAVSTKTANVPIGKRLKLLVLITNKGPDRASVVTLNLALPPQFRFVRVASTTVKCTIRPLECTLAELLPGQSTQAVFTLESTVTGKPNPRRTRLLAHLQRPRPHNCNRLHHRQNHIDPAFIIHSFIHTRPKTAAHPPPT